MSGRHCGHNGPAGVTRALVIMWQPPPLLLPSHLPTKELHHPCALSKCAGKSHNVFPPNQSPHQGPLPPPHVLKMCGGSPRCFDAAPNTLRVCVFSRWWPTRPLPPTHLPTQDLHQPRTFSKCVGDLPRHLDAAADATGQRTLHIHILSGWRAPTICAFAVA